MTNTEDLVRMELSLERNADPIRGWLEMNGQRRRFAGWVELAGALQAARDGAPGAGPKAQVGGGEAGATDGR